MTEVENSGNPRVKFSNFSSYDIVMAAYTLLTEYAILGRKGTVVKCCFFPAAFRLERGRNYL